MSQVPLGGGKSESRDGNSCAMKRKLKEAGRKLEEFRGSM